MYLGWARAILLVNSTTTMLINSIELTGKMENGTDIAARSGSLSTLLALTLSRKGRDICISPKKKIAATAATRPRAAGY
jgi:hypothetical protein